MNEDTPPAGAIAMAVLACVIVALCLFSAVLF
jgi:hypothetical protein